MPVDLTPQQSAYVERVRRNFFSTEALHRRYEQRWNHHYALYRSYADWKAEMAGANPRDRDTGLQEAKRQWGATLFIPFVFSTIETILPRMVSHRPRMLVLPGDKDAETNVDNMKWLIDHQQQQIAYDLTLQTVGKNGLIYGLGVQKTGWCTEQGVENYIKKGMASQQNPSGYVQGQRPVTYFDDPYAESVDPYDFFWDPFAASVNKYVPNKKGADWIIHRTWQSNRYVNQMFQSEQWGGVQPDGQELPVLTPDEVSSLGSVAKFDEIWQQRMRAQGHSDFMSRGNQLHEIWEWHDGSEVITILDRQIPVRCGPNPYWHGQIPFQVYRPTEDPHQMVGIGEPEALEDLQEEMNTLRTQRRDAATMSLNAPFAYYEGLVDPADIKWGPNQAIPVAGNPQEMLYQFRFGDIPGSSYNEEAALKEDIKMTSGVLDAVAGADQPGATSATATGAQLVQANINTRIELKTRRLETELIRSAAYQWIRLNQQYVIEKPVPVPEPPDPANPGEVVWRTRVLTPPDLAGTMLGLPEGGATAPDNIPQQRADAQSLMNEFKNDPMVNQRWLYVHCFRGYGIQHPEVVIAPPQPGVPVDALLSATSGMGLDPQQMQRAVAIAQRQSIAEDQDAEEEPSMNGAGNGSGPAR